MKYKEGEITVQDELGRGIRRRPYINTQRCEKKSCGYLDAGRGNDCRANGR